MKTYLLVIVLGFNPSVLDQGETHVAVFMPDEDTCLELRDAYVHAVDIRWDPNGPQDAFTTLDDDRTELSVVEVRCESAATDDS